MNRGLKRIDDLIERSLTEVRLRIDSRVYPVRVDLLQMVDQILVTAELEAQAKNQILEVQIEPNLTAIADQHLLYSAVSNLIQNALKFTHVGGKIQIRGKKAGETIAIEVEDECGGLSNDLVDLFKPFEQQNENRKGLGLGLTIARRAALLNKGTIEVSNIPGKGCIFKITLPEKTMGSDPTH